MTREWQPGDVANVLHRGFQPAFRHQKGWTYIDGSTATAAAADGYTFRPLVVIDPEDREQIERLADELHHVRVGHRLGNCYPAEYEHMQAALRNLADPPSPRPDEPRLLGAVIEDGNGVLWVRAGDSHDGVLDDNWRQVAGEHVGQWQRWDRIAGPRVLSPGYDPEATS